MDKKKIYIALGIVGFIALIGVALYFFLGKGGSPNSNSGNQQAVLNIWGTFETSDNMQPFLTAFNEQYPNVQIQYTQINVDDYESTLLNALATNQGPDIFVIHNDWLPKYQDKMVPAPAAIMPLRDFKTNFVDAVYSDFVSNGQIYAAPISMDTLALFYNKDILGSAGIAIPARTWTDLKNQVKKITIKGTGSFINRSGVALGTTANINRAVDDMYLFMLQDRAQPYNGDFSQPTFDQAITLSNGQIFYPTADALNFYTSFSNPTSDVYTWNTNSPYSIDAFANGEVGYMFGYSYFRDLLAQKSPNLNYDVAPVPQPSLNDTLVNFANYWGFGVSKQSKNQTIAWNFIKFMTSKSSLEDYYKRHKLPSPRKDIISEQVNDPDIGVFASANLTAKTFPKKDQTQVDNIFLGMIDDVVLRGRSLNDAISNAAQQISALGQ